MHLSCRTSNLTAITDHYCCCMSLSENKNDFLVQMSNGFKRKKYNVYKYQINDLPGVESK